MSETQRTLFNKRAGGLLIAGAFILLMIVVVVGVLSPSPPEPEVVKERTDSVLHRVRSPLHTPSAIYLLVKTAPKVLQRAFSR